MNIHKNQNSYLEFSGSTKALCDEDSEEEDYSRREGSTSKLQHLVTVTRWDPEGSVFVRSPHARQ